MSRSFDLLHEAMLVARKCTTGRSVAPRPGTGEKDAFACEDRAAGKRQETLLEAFAREAGVWHDQADRKIEQCLGPAFEGGETKAYFDEANCLAVKLITPSYYAQPLWNLERVVLHNRYFPDSPLKLVGFGRTVDDWGCGPMFVLKVEQPLVKIERSATTDEIDAYMTGLGCRQFRPETWLSADGEAVISDLNPENAVIDQLGNVRVIDADLRLNTPRLGYGGDVKASIILCIAAERVYSGDSLRLQGPGASGLCASRWTFAVRTACEA